MAATLLAVSATVAPDSHHEHGLQVTAVSDVPEELGRRSVLGPQRSSGAKIFASGTLHTYGGVRQMCKRT